MSITKRKVEIKVINCLKNKILRNNPKAIIYQSKGKHFLGFGVSNNVEDIVNNVQRIFDIFPRDDRLKKQRKLLKKLERVPIQRQRELELEYLKPGKTASLSFIGELLNRVSDRLITLVISNDEDYVMLQRFVTDSKDNYVVLDDNQWLIKAVRRYIKRHPVKINKKSKRHRRKHDKEAIEEIF